MLTINLGDPVSGRIDGHSAINGAVIPAGSTLTLVSNDPATATVPDSIPVPTDTNSVPYPVTVLASGATDITATITTPSGDQFTAVDSLVVNPAVVPGLTHITNTLTSP